jgi:hypothetical protein
MAEWQHFTYFQDGGGGLLAKWLYTSAFPFFELSMHFSVRVQIYSKPGDKWLLYPIPMQFSYTV